uniref:Uncharacterized protein n=1 Tax=Arion vulgaris TaxID=1028688 RepID=A0A0B7BIW3_9EUPU
MNARMPRTVDPLSHWRLETSINYIFGAYHNKVENIFKAPIRLCGAGARKGSKK